jgi:diguanylate cyclase (GGDEF)-like protein
MGIRLRSLETRITLTCLLMIFVVQMAGFFVIRTSIDTNARASLRSELAVGEKIFLRLLEQKAQTLTESARLLASDYGFRAAIGTNDTDTIASALTNQGDRIGASLAVLVDPSGQIRATSEDVAGQALQEMAVMLVRSAEATGSANRVMIAGNQPYQTVAVPVKAPVTIGWVVMAFPISQDLVRDMLDLSLLQVTVLSKSGDSPWKVNLTTLNPKGIAVVTNALQNVRSTTGLSSEMTVLDTEYSTRVLRIAQEGGQTSIAVLQRSVSEAVAPYRELQLTLLILTAIGVLVAAVASAVTARRITVPLRHLAETAKRLGTGDYSKELATQRDDEIGDLSRAFEGMREGIAQREVEIGRLAYWDMLTDLPNRAQFTKLLNGAIKLAQHSQADCHVLMMDLDRFKHVNDVLGHGFGDMLLKQVAQRLRSLPENRKVRIARLGGDEFAMLLPDSSVTEAKALAAKILKSLEMPISLDGQTVDLGAGIGIAAYPAHGTDAESLLSRAEVAMYVAKKSGNEAVVYDPCIDDASALSLSLLSDLRRAVERNELRFYVQPKIMLDSGKLIGMEALVRWMHPESGMVPPDKFIPFAEKTGVIRLITMWMLEQATLLLKVWIAKGVRLKISVNLSTRDLLDQDLPAKFGEILLRNNVPSNLFCLEITESAIMDDPVRALQTLDRLHAMGVDLSIDDFGTGYSSLSYLKRLPVHELKIDKSFVMNLESGTDDAAIVRSTIDLGHHMGLRVVAEGVENREVWTLLESMGCDQGQGFFISKPMPAEQLQVWMENWATSQDQPLRHSA